MTKYNSNRYSRLDNCPVCGQQYFKCCDYLIDDLVYLHEEQCPKCCDFFQVTIGVQSLIYSGGTESSLIK